MSVDFHINFDFFLSLGMVTDEGSQLNYPTIPGTLKLTHFKIATNCEAGYWIRVIYYYSSGLALVWALQTVRTVSPAIQPYWQEPGPKAA